MANANNFRTTLMDESRDAKTRLNIFLQKHSGRMITKEDVVYTTGKVSDGTMYQSTVQLNCMNDAPIFAGQLHKDKKGAEKEAAQQALTMYAEEIKQMIANPAAFNKRAREGAAPPPPPKQAKTEAGGPKSELTPKGEIHQAIMKIVRRTANKEDCLFNTQKTPTGFISTLQLPCLPGELASKQWMGSYAGTQKAAENSVSELALADIRADPVLAGQIDATKKKTPPPQKKDPWDWLQEQMFKMTGGSGGQRKPVVDSPVTGDIAEFKGKFGYIKPHAPVDHPKILQNAGKIWFALDDVEGKGDGGRAPEWLKEGNMVSFQVYEDMMGEIGAYKIATF